MLTIYNISVLTCEKVILRNNDYFKLIFYIFRCVLKLFYKLHMVKGCSINFTAIYILLINRMNRSSQCLKVSLFIGPEIYISPTEFAQGKDLWDTSIMGHIKPR